MTELCMDFTNQREIPIMLYGLDSRYIIFSLQWEITLK